MGAVKSLKRMITAVVLATSMSLTVGSVGYAQEYMEGRTAYRKGDYSTAIKIWIALGNKGDAESQNNVGWMYYKGQGVTRDFAKAMKWFRKAASQGNSKAQTSLGVMYENGEGFTRSYKKAVEWYRKAAAQGFAIAHANLAYMYEKGRGVEQSFVYSHMWFELAALLGNKRGKTGQSRVRKQMTAAQRAEAQKLARECVRKKYKGC